MRCGLISTLFRTCLAISVASTGFAQFSTYPGNPPGYPQSQQQYPSSVPPSVPQGAPPTGMQPAGGGQPGAQGDLNDPEDRRHGVARVSIAQGDVNVKRADNGQLDAAVVNAPLMTHDHLETAPGSRAEVQLDAANFIRLGPNTELGFADLQYRRYQAQLGIGTIILRVTHDTNADVEIDTPSVTLRPLGQGEYRVSVFDNGTSQVTVRSGRLEMYGPSGSQRVDAGQSLLIRGDAANPEFQAGYEIARDQLDDWSATRDNELLSSQSYGYVSPDIGGAQDLDANGAWVPSQYGQVWTPQAVSSDWSPYSDGHWVYANYYGWTWIDNAPWGWAPYHYGRWFMNSGRWCWWPGARAGAYFWSPALVGFFGFGRGGLGWAALAPFEVGFSWWGRGHDRGGFGYGGYGFNRGVGFGGLYRNAGFRGGAMTASLDGFGGPNQRFRPATHGQLAGASVFRGQLPVSPGQGAYRFSSRSAVANPRLSAGTNRQFFSREMAGRGGTRTGSGVGGIRSGSSTGGGGWQRFGSPGNSGATRQNFSGADRSGWHTFGQPSYRGNSPSPSYRYQGQGGGYGQRQGYTGQSSPRYNAPASQPRYGGAPQSQHYNAPAQQHYSTPQFHGGGGGGGSRGGGGSHSSGGSGGHRGR